MANLDLNMPAPEVAMLDLNLTPPDARRRLHASPPLRCYDTDPNQHLRSFAVPDPQLVVDSALESRSSANARKSTARERRASASSPSSTVADDSSRLAIVHLIFDNINPDSQQALTCTIAKEMLQDFLYAMINDDMSMY